MSRKGITGSKKDVERDKVQKREEKAAKKAAKES